MPRTQLVVRILVASPSDTQDERDTVDDVVEELNATWAGHSGVRLETIRWERDSYPATGTSPQDVINAQLGADYDILLCMFWLKWGTPTARATSGTEEEFRLALARHHANPSSVRIMVYFKDVPVSPSHISIEDYQRIASFRESLSSLGVLYAAFSSTEDLTRLLRMHLSKAVQAFVDAASSSGTGSSATTSDEVVTPRTDEDEGYFDLIERGVDRNQESLEVMVRLTEATEELGKRVTAITVGLGAVSSQPSRQAIAETRHLIDQAGAELTRYAERLEVSLPLLKVAYAESMEAYAEAATLMVELGVEGDKKRTVLGESLQILGSYVTSMTGARGELTDMRESIRRLPRLTTYLNRAKKRALAAVDGLVRELDAAVGYAQNTTRVIEEMVRK